MKKVLSVQDLSCLGKCSLTVALPVLSAMGLSCTVLPTAVLSTHTAFPKPYIRSLTEDISAIGEHWKSIDAEFDAIGIGYLSDPAQAEAVAALLDRFPAFTVLDPVMGDGGKRYSGITQAHTDAVRRLCSKADLIVPNVTEACLLTGESYEAVVSREDYCRLMKKLKTLCPRVVLTGVSLQPEQIGFMTDSEAVFQTDKIPMQCHGTGDLFAAVLTGGIALGKDTETAAAEAAKFVQRVLADTPEPTPFGIPFERQLPSLWK